MRINIYRGQVAIDDLNNANKVPDTIDKMPDNAGKMPDTMSKVPDNEGTLYQNNFVMKCRQIKKTSCESK